MTFGYNPFIDNFDFKGATTGFVTSVTGTANRITVTAGLTPQVDIASNYVGQSSITTLGTVSSGTWNATPVTVGFGGTGRSSLDTFGVLTGGTTSTGNVQSIPSVGIGQVFASGGVGVLPAWTDAPTLTSVTLSGGNPLSKYIVGSFTPELLFGGANVGMTYNFNTGFYTQIGDVVNFTIYISLGSLGSSTGDATISGFPVATGPDGIFYANIVHTFFGITLPLGYTQIFCKMQSNTTLCDIFTCGSGQTASQSVSSSMMAAQPTIALTGFYKIN